MRKRKPCNSYQHGFAMTIKDPKFPKASLLLLVGVFGHVDGAKWISMNDQNASTYTTSGQAVSIVCTIAIPDQPGAFIAVNQAIWRAVGASTELSPSSPQWSVVIDNLNRPGYTPDPARMSIWFGEQPSVLYMKIGLTIHVPLPSDSGQYICNGSYIAQSGGSIIVENSAQVHLSVTGTAQAATWITVNSWYWPSYFNIGQYRRVIYRLECNSYVNDNRSSITEQKIFKTQNYMIDPLNGSSPYVYKSGSAVMRDYKSQFAQKTDISMMEPSQPSPQQMTSPLLFGLDASNTGTYSCNMQYRTGDLSSTSQTVLNLTIDVPEEPDIQAEAYGEDAFNIRKNLGLGNFLTDDKIIPADILMALVIFEINIRNEVPAFQVTVNNEDVTRDINTTYSKPSIEDARSTASDAFRKINYRSWHSYNFPVTSVCTWTVSCRAWVPSTPSQKYNVSVRLITRSCFEKERGSALFSKASLTRASYLKSSLAVWKILSALLVQNFA